MNATAQKVAERAREYALSGNSDPLETAVVEFAAQAGLTYSQEAELRGQSQKNLIGHGALEEYLNDSTIEEIWINRPNEVFIARSGVAERIFLSE